MKTIPDQRFYKDYKQDELKQKSSWIKVPREIGPDIKKGKLLFYQNSWFEYQKGYRDKYAISLTFYFLSVSILLIGLLFWDSISEPIILILSLGFFFFAGTMWLYITKSMNWFSVFENGIQPQEFPFDYDRG